MCFQVRQSLTLHGVNPNVRHEHGRPSTWCHQLGGMNIRGPSAGERDASANKEAATGLLRAGLARSLILVLGRTSDPSPRGRRFKVGGRFAGKIKRAFWPAPPGERKLAKQLKCSALTCPREHDPDSSACTRKAADKMFQCVTHCKLGKRVRVSIARMPLHIQVQRHIV